MDSALDVEFEPEWGSDSHAIVRPRIEDEPGMRLLGAGLIPPHDPTAESAVLLSCLLEPDNIPLMRALLKEEHFFLGRSQLIYRALCHLSEANTSVRDMLPATITFLRERGWLAYVEGAAGLVRWMGEVAATGSIERSARAIRDSWRMRELGTLAQLTLGLVYGPYEDAQRVLDQVAQRAFELAGDTPLFTATTSVDLAKKVVKQFVEDDRRLRAGDATGDVRSGFDAIDARIVGFAPSSLTIIGARPGMGKTSLMLAIALNAARRGEPVYIVTCEMPAEDLMRRAAGMAASVPFSRIRQPNTMTQAETSAFFDALRELSELPITWEGLEAPSVAELRAKVERVKATQARQGRPLRLVLVDYLGKLKAQGTGRASTAEERTGSIVRGLKGAAMATQLPWVVPAQLNRAVTQGGTIRRPQMSDLRGSGEIEQEADFIAFIHREDYVHKQAGTRGYVPTGDAEFIISKQRNGPTETAMLRFVDEFTRFEAHPEYA